MRFWFCFAACSATGVEPSLLLGERGLTGYHVLAGGSVAVPQGSLGFAVSADGRGGYTIDWTGDASGSSFAGSATTDVGFDPNGTVKVSDSEQVTFTAANRIDFSGVPGVTLQGLQLTAMSEPIYLDLTVAGSHAVSIFFAGGKTRLVQESAFDPVAFTSP